MILHADVSRGGAERYTIDLAAGLRARGHAVTLLAGDAAEAVPQVVTLGARGLTRVGRYRAIQQALTTHLTEHRYDVVHAMLPVLGCDLYHPHAGVAAEAIRTGSPLSRLGNRFNRRRHAMAEAERELLSASQPPIVLCLSDHLKQTVRHCYPGLDESRLVKLFNGTDLHRFDPASRPTAGSELRQRLGLAAADVVALLIAQDFERKGLGQTLEALPDDPRLKLVVVGKQDPGPYRTLAQTLGCASRVTFAGPTTDPYAFYQSADFFVLPTRHDPCSLVVLEALAMGVPVITTINNGAAEAMTPGRHGMVLGGPDDLDALAVAMRSLLDPQVRRPMREACLALRPALSMETHLDRLEAAYRLSIE